MPDAPRQTPLWEPSAQDRERARMTKFMRWAGERHERTFADYDELWRWSVEEIEDFWADIWEFCGVRASRPYERVLTDRGSEDPRSPSTGCPARAGLRARS